jgi:predicted GNAT family N-acyltransferase
LGFYQDLGFIERGDVYLEDNIDHIEMCLESPKK